MKLPEHKLGSLLKNVGLTALAEDCTVNEISATEILLTNIDVVTPIHDDPYIMGKIAACNVTNDLFAKNAVQVVNYSCFLGLPVDLPAGFAEAMLQGMRDFLKPLGTDIHGGHTIQNPWPLLGGSASAIIPKSEFIAKRGVREGDCLLLTKPQGIQAIMAAYRVRKSNPDILQDIDKSRIELGIKLAEKSMTMSNRIIPQFLRQNKFISHIHAMTDITGFGLKGHLGEMIGDSQCGAQITHLPVFPAVPELNDIFNYKINEGCGSEIAGAMLMAVDKAIAADVVKSMQDNKIWVDQIGKITRKSQQIQFASDFRYNEIDKF